MVALCSEDSFYVLRYDAEYDGEPDEVIRNICDYISERFRLLFQSILTS